MSMSMSTEQDQMPVCAVCGQPASYLAVAPAGTLTATIVYSGGLVCSARCTKELHRQRSEERKEPSGPDQSDELRRQQRTHGTCSGTGCNQPVAGWCATCTSPDGPPAPKLCATHLNHHTATSLPARHWPTVLPVGNGQPDGAA